MNQLDNLSIEKLGQLFPIIISEPDNNWKNLYNAEKSNIESILGNKIIRIEHIGSTAVPNLKAKPTIDILLEVSEDTDNTMIINSIKELGYNYIPRPENPVPHMMFVKGYTDHGFEGQAYHIHIRYSGDWDEIYFRDYLIKNPEIAWDYAVLKQQLAKKYKNDREEYTAKKTDFIKRITNIAKKELKR